MGRDVAGLILPTRGLLMGDRLPPEYIGSRVYGVSNVNDYPLTFSVAGAQAGDLIIFAMTFEVDGDSTWTWTGIPFTDIYDATGNDNPGAYVGYAFWDGVTTNISVSGVGSGDWNRQATIVSVFRNVSTLVNSAVDTGFLGSPNPPAVSGAGRLHIATGHLDDDNVNMTAPSGWTRAAAIAEGGANSASTVIAYNFSGLNDPAAFGGSSDEWRATTSVWD